MNFLDRLNLFTLYSFCCGSFSHCRINNALLLLSSTTSSATAAECWRSAAPHLLLMNCCLKVNYKD